MLRGAELLLCRRSSNTFSSWLDDSMKHSCGAILEVSPHMSVHSLDEVVSRCLSEQSTPWFLSRCNFVFLNCTSVHLLEISGSQMWASESQRWIGHFKFGKEKVHLNNNNHLSIYSCAESSWKRKANIGLRSGASFCGWWLISWEAKL